LLEYQNILQHCLSCIPT